jgi:hypothetical protein
MSLCKVFMNVIFSAVCLFSTSNAADLTNVPEDNTTPTKSTRFETSPTSTSRASSVTSVRSEMYTKFKRIKADGTRATTQDLALAFVAAKEDIKIYNETYLNLTRLYKIEFTSDDVTANSELLLQTADISKNRLVELEQKAKDQEIVLREKCEEIAKWKKRTILGAVAGGLVVVLIQIVIKQILPLRS